MPESPWRGIRWNYVANTLGVGATGTGMVLSQPGKLYAVRGVARSANGYLMLYDHTNLPQNSLLPLSPSPGTPDIGWRTPMAIPLNNGLYVSYSMGTGGLDLFAAWDK